MRIEVIRAITHGLDWFALGVMFLIGGFTAIKPYKAWNLFKSKKNKDIEPNIKTIKSTRWMGILIMFLIAIVIVEKVM